MWHCHELGQCRSSQYGVVGSFEVGYFELDVLCQEVMFCTECDWKGNRANWCRRISGNNAIERGLALSEQTHVVEAHLCQCASKDQVEPISAVDEYLLTLTNDYFQEST